MMMRMLVVGWLSVWCVASASAHFVFLLPDGASKGKAVFSDALKPDAVGVPVEKIAQTKLTLIVDGKSDEVKWTHDAKANCYTFDVGGSGSRLVYGTTDYGIFQRGESKPQWLKYHAKGLFGELPTPDKATLGDQVPVEIIPVVEGGKLRFKVLAKGKPIVKTDVTVLIPGENKAVSVTTDADGLTESFDKAGLYGAVAKLVEDKAGEQDGKKYEEIRHYATLVVALGK